jgi:hypothetical protein
MVRNPKRTRLFLEKLEARRLMSVYADFNGDGFDDLAIGVPGEDSGAGMVQMLYGAASGLSATGSQSWTQSSISGADPSESGDRFGVALAGGDFNKDGFADLAIGAPGEDIGSIVDAGAIHVLLGSATGLTSTGSKFFHQNSNRVRDISETGDNFGAALAAGDFNGDGFFDLAIGVPAEDVGASTDAGMVQTLYGAPSGLIPGFNPPWTMNDPNIPGDPNAFDYFGTSLAAGDFNNDGRDDLAIGVPYQDSGNSDSGAVVTMFGTTNGLSAIGSDLMIIPDQGQILGLSLAIGDFNGDGFDDLAAGAPFDNTGSVPNAGEIVVWHGTPTTSLVFSQNLNQGLIGATNESNDYFGTALSAADLTGDGVDDLAIGVPGEETGATQNVGQVIVIPGSALGFVFGQSVYITDLSGATDDQIGETLTLGNFDNSGSVDLAIGVPHDDVGSAIDAGSVIVIYTSGLSYQVWNQDSPGIADTAEFPDGFGGGLDSGAGRGHYTSRDPALLITWVFDFDTHIHKLKHRILGGRR